MKRIILIAIVIVHAEHSFCQAPLKGLRSYYPFSGNANDFMGENNGTVQSVQLVSDRFGNDESAYLFDGVDDHIRIDNPDFATDSEGTFSAWIKFNSLEGIQYVAGVGDEDSQNNYISLVRFDPDSMKLSIYNGDPVQTNWLFGSTLIETDKYYHVVMTSNSTEWQLIVNNKKEVLVPRAGQNRGEWFNAISGMDNFIIGGLSIQQPHLPANFNGIIDDVRVYGRVLDSAEIANLYYENKCYESVTDTVTVYESITVYDTVTVTDTLVIDFSYLNVPEIVSSKVKVFPNPTQRIIKISIQNYEQLTDYSVRISNASGSNIFERTINEPELEVDMYSLGGVGLYFIEIIDSDSHVVDTKKIVLR